MWHIGGNHDHVTLVLGLGYGYRWGRATPATVGSLCFARCMFNINNFIGSVTLAEVCALLSVILVFIDSYRFTCVYQT